MVFDTPVCSTGWFCFVFGAPLWAPALLFPSLGWCTYVYVFSFAAKENIQALVCSCAYPCTNQKFSDAKMDHFVQLI